MTKNVRKGGSFSDFVYKIIMTMARAFLLVNATNSHVISMV